MHGGQAAHHHLGGGPRFLIKAVSAVECLLNSDVVGSSRTGGGESGVQPRFFFFELLDDAQLVQRCLALFKQDSNRW